MIRCDACGQTCYETDMRQTALAPAAEASASAATYHVRHYEGDYVFAYAVLRTAEGRRREVCGRCLEAMVTARTRRASGAPEEEGRGSEPV